MTATLPAASLVAAGSDMAHTLDRMGTGINQLVRPLAGDPETLRASARDLQAQKRALHDVASAVRSEVGALTGSWRGTSQVLALIRVQDVHRRIGALGDHLDAASAAMAKRGDQLGAGQSEMALVREEVKRAVVAGDAGALQQALARAEQVHAADEESRTAFSAALDGARPGQVVATITAASAAFTGLKDVTTNVRTVSEVARLLLHRTVGGIPKTMPAVTDIEGATRSARAGARRAAERALVDRRLLKLGEAAKWDNPVVEMLEKAAARGGRVAAGAVTAAEQGGAVVADGAAAATGATSALKVAAKIAGRVSGPIAIGTGIHDMLNGDADHPGWRDAGTRIVGGISVVGGVATAAALATPVGAGVAIGAVAVGAAWAGGTAIYDNWPTIKGGAQRAWKGAGDLTRRAADGVASAGRQVADVASTGGRLASDLASGAASKVASWTPSMPKLSGVFGG